MNEFFDPPSHKNQCFEDDRNGVVVNVLPRIAHDILSAYPQIKLLHKRIVTTLMKHACIFFEAITK